MASEKRITLKNFNQDLLIEDLSGSALPFISVSFAGFERVSQFIGSPATEPRQISRVRQNDGTYEEDFAEPGEIRFEFADALTVRQVADLDALLSAHDSTKKTLEQLRTDQDKIDLDQLVATFENFDSFSNVQFRRFLKLLARVVIRERRTPPI